MAAPSRFTPVQRNPAPPPPRQQPSSAGSPVFPIFLVILYAVYLGGAIVAPLFVGSLSELLDSYLEPLVRVIIAGVLFVLFAGIIAYMTFFQESSDQPSRPLPPPPTARPKTTAPQPAPGKFKPVSKPASGPDNKKPASVPKKEASNVKDKADVEKEREGPVIIPYPLEVEGGIFGDTYIRLSEKKVLKLRSMIITPDQMS